MASSIFVSPNGLSFTGTTVTFPGSITLPSTSAVVWSGRGQLTSPADGTVALLTAAGTVGASLSTTLHGDGTLSARNKADTGNADFYANNLGLAAKVTTFNGVSTAGFGTPAIYAYARATAQVGADSSVATYTPTADGSFQVSANVLVTTATSHAFTVTCAYTDEGNTARTLTLPFTLVAGAAIVTSVANGNGTVPYMGLVQHIRVKANTSITIATTGTFTTVAYNVEGFIAQVAA